MFLQFHRTFCATLLFYTFAMVAMAGETTRVSIASNGKQGNFGSYGSSLSADGRIVTFMSYADDLVLGDINNASDIFVYDRQTHQTTRVSVATDKLQGNGDSSSPSLSADGRYVAFMSFANNLVASDTNGIWDVFVHDRQTHKTSLISVDSSGLQANPHVGSTIIAFPSLSADGRFVAFYSEATNLVVGDTNNYPDIFIHDRLTHQTTRVSVGSNGMQGNGGVGYFFSISGDGRYVSFSSIASNLVNVDQNDEEDMFVHDRQTKQTERISINSIGIEGYKASYGPSSITPNGRYIAFSSKSPNFGVGDTNNDWDIFVRDRQTKQTSRVSVSTSGKQGNSSSWSPSISADGRMVAFWSSSTNMVVGDTNGHQDVFVHDRLTKETLPVSVDSSGVLGSGEQNGSIAFPQLSADGRYVTFVSDAVDLIIGDTNNAPDVFVRDRLLDNIHHADLKITNTQKPSILSANSYGIYQFTVTNNGPDTVSNVSLIHMVSNGGSQAVSFFPSQGNCRRYPVISLCQLGKLLPGKSLNLLTVAKAVRDPLIQRISASGAPMDPIASNNRAYVSTKVTP